MIYPDGTQIPSNLPDTYRPASTYNPPSGDPTTIGESCKNCKRFDSGYCNWWNAAVRYDYYCHAWAQIERKKKKK